MELHFVYGGIAAKNFILPISKSCKNESIIFYQKSSINDNLTINGISALPNWFDIKISPKLNFLILIRSLFYLSRLLKKHPNCEVITHMTTYSFFALIISLLVKVKKRIYFNHGFAHIGSKGFEKIFLFTLEFFNCLFASKVITVSPSHLNFIKKGLIYKAAEIKSTYPGSCSGIDKSKLISLDALNKKCLNLSSRDNYIYLSYIGRPYVRKGFPFILKIFELIRDKMPSTKIKLQIIGITKDQIFDKLNEKDNIRFIDPVGYTNDVFYYLRKSSITILPSLREGFGYALLEGAASGNALVTFNMIGPDSLVKNNYNGILIPYGNDPKVYANEICKLINNLEKLKRFMKNSRESAKNFEQDIILESLRKIL